MSKSLGNGIDPIDLIDRYGADATRFSLMQQAGKNQDIRYSEQRTQTAVGILQQAMERQPVCIAEPERCDDGTVAAKGRSGAI